MNKTIAAFVIVGIILIGIIALMATEIMAVDVGIPILTLTVGAAIGYLFPSPLNPSS
jgi:hypothetical protein